MGGGGWGAKVHLSVTPLLGALNAGKQSGVVTTSTQNTPEHFFFFLLSLFLQPAAYRAAPTFWLLWNVRTKGTFVLAVGDSLALNGGSGGVLSGARSHVSRVH